MQNLTLLAVLLCICSSAQAAPDRSATVAAAVKTDLALAKGAADARDANAAAMAVRDAVRPKLGRLSDDDVVVALIALSDRMGAEDRLGEALRLGQHALDMTRAGALGPGLEFDSLTRTGSMRYMLDDYDGAARDLDAARRAAARIAPFDANSVANATANYAVTLDQSGRYREAETALREAIALRARAAEQRPASIAVAWLALAAVHKRMGRHDLSEEDYRTGLHLLEEAGQASGAGYAGALHNYGVLMGELGRDADATALYRRATDILPADRRHTPSMVNNYTSLAASLMALGRLDDAAMAVRDAERAAAAKSKPDGGTVNVLSARAQLSARQGDTAAAERDASAALALARTILAPGNIQLAEDLVILSDALLQNGKAAAARVAADEAVAISADIADRNPLKAIAHDMRAAALLVGNDPAGALSASRDAAETQARRFAAEGAATPVPLQPEERDIAARRIALLWGIGKR